MTIAVEISLLCSYNYCHRCHFSMLALRRLGADSTPLRSMVGPEAGGPCTVPSVPAHRMRPQTHLCKANAGFPLATPNKTGLWTHGGPLFALSPSWEIWVQLVFTSNHPGCRLFPRFRQFYTAPHCKSSFRLNKHISNSSKSHLGTLNDPGTLYLFFHRAAPIKDQKNLDIF